LFPTAFRAITSNIWRSADLSFLLGNGRLNYGRENILETSYTLDAWRGVHPSFGFQFVDHPGYDRDRGPVFVPTLRLHIEF
jgi:high affinity Mn2+ porin